VIGLRSLARYARWLHTGFPAGVVEPLPELGPAGTTRVPGLHVTGDLTGVPLLKLALQSGVDAVRAIHADPAFARDRARLAPGVVELLIVGAGVSGMAAAKEALRLGLAPRIYEAARAFQTIADFPRRKPIYTYPRGLTPEGPLQVRATVKEDLLDELERQTEDVAVDAGRVESVERRGGELVVRLAGGEEIRALRVILALGRTGDYRKLGAPGEDRDHVHHRLHDPGEFQGRRALVVGGGDSAVETALALHGAGAHVTLVHRGARLARPKLESLDALGRAEAEGRLAVELDARVTSIDATDVRLARRGEPARPIPADVVFVQIGREAPLGLLRRAGVRIAGDWTRGRVLALAAFVLFCAALYDWKSGGTLEAWHRAAGGFPFAVESWLSGHPRGSLADVLRVSASAPSFYYTLAYSALVLVFGSRRMRRRATPYVRVQTLTLIAIQVVPLFLLPEIVLPWLDANGLLPAWIADGLFPRADYGHGREFWRAYGLILAWPLFVYNVFTDAPLVPWLVISVLQTFVLIPAIVIVWGKGAYCGWICSCGALAETFGDTHRHKMPHGQGWNRLNLAGQAILALALVLAALRVVAWCFPEWHGLRAFNHLALSGSALSYKWIVDVLLAGVLGYGLYFWYSGRVWCRFFCPLAALMHVYARFSRFRILPEKNKCISCNVCTQVCHQGIDVMSFANRGLPMDDPQCVRCSACVSSCPTGVLTFGQVDRAGRVVRTDRLAASLVQIREAGGS
jgi:thioredoxin reductase/ferredoxin